MHPTEIQARLKRRKVTQRSIAKKLGRSAFHVSAVIRGLRESDRVQRAVADAIGKAPEKVFPQYYARKNGPKQRSVINNA